MACKMAGMGAGGYGFMGGAFGGVPGMSAASSSIVNNITNNVAGPLAKTAAAAASGAIGDPSSFPLVEIAADTAAAVANVGVGSDLAATLTGGAIPGTGGLMTDAFDLGASMLAHATEYIPPDISSGIQIFDQVANFSQTSLDIMPNITRILNTDFGGITNIAKDFADGGFLGEAINNFDELLTNGLGNLTDGISGSFDDLASGFANIGKFGNVADFANIMQPGQLVSQMLNEGLGDIAGIANKLLENGIPLDDLTNPLFQNKIQGIMNGVTDLVDLRDIQSVMGSSLNLNNLGQLTNISKVIDGNLGKSFSSFAELGDKLQFIETGAVSSLGELGEMMSEMGSGADISQLINETKLMSQDFYDNIAGIYGSGTGPDGSVLLRDVLGTVGGYGIEDYIPTYDQAYGLLNDAGVTGTLSAMYTEMNEALAGDYTDVSAGTLTDPRSGSVFSELDELINHKVTQISQEISNIASNPSQNVQELIDTARNNWTAVSNQLNTELTNVSVSDIDTSLVTPGSKGSIVSFAQQLTTYGQDPDNRADYLERIAAPTLTGGFMKFGLREGKNLAKYAEKEINYAGILIDEQEDIDPFPSDV